MRRNEVDYLLGTLLDFNKDVSDIIFTVDRPPQVEVAGQLLAVPTQPPMPKLTPFQTEMIALNLIAGNQRLIDDLLSLSRIEMKLRKVVRETMQRGIA